MAVAGKVVGLSGCGLALVFWILIPIGFILVAMASTSSEGFYAVALVVGLIVAFFSWVWRRTGKS